VEPQNALKHKLRRGEVACGMVVRLVAGNEIVMLARTAGIDSIYVDLENSTFSIETAAGICLMALAEGLPCLVRVPENTRAWISRVLDAGAAGIIAPDVRTADEARAIVKAAKYPPEGARGISTGLPHYGFGSFQAGQGHGRLNAETLVVVQCESGEAVENAASIAAVEGVDMILVGTNDLLAEQGIAGEFDHAYVREAYGHVIEACRAHGKYSGVGGLMSRPKLVSEFIGQGARYVSLGTDLGFLLEGARSRTDWLRGLAIERHQ
jgi:2-keto-3-deoxy-L-rhamnonate aldolase RhmA